MKTLIPIAVAVIGVGALLAVARLGQRWQRQPRDPIEYYEMWGGYDAPIHLINRITKEEAGAQAARGYAYMVGYFDTQGQLVRAVSMHHGAVFFDHEYTYDPRGRLTHVKTTNPDGVVSEVEYPGGKKRRVFR
jgi:hypothetical protein